MHFLYTTSYLLACLSTWALTTANPSTTLDPRNRLHSKAIEPKVFIIDMFPPEGDAWYGIPEFDLLAKNITVPGLSPLFPDVHCTSNYEVCQIVTGESEINAAASITALTFSPKFNLKKTYFLIAGIAGINPKIGTLGSVTFARYTVQVGLQYEIDAREIPENFSTGYFPQGSASPNQYPKDIYGTEVFEVNLALRDIALSFAKTASLNDSSAAQAYRARYASTIAYKAGSEPPSVLACDVATADVYFTGALLSEAFENTTKLFTNNTGVYCTTAQEDSATLEALLRGSVSNQIDFSRIIIMRTASDFDRPYGGESAIENLLTDQGGFEPAIENIYLAGVKVVEGILRGWQERFRRGIKASNYIGDIFGTLGGTPDFGPGGTFGNNPVIPSRKRGLRPQRRVIVSG